MRAIMLASWLLLFGGPADAASITIMTSGGLNTACRALAPQYESISGNRLTIIQGASMGANPTAIPARLDRGEAADVVIMIRSALDKLVAKGQVSKDGVTNLGIGRIAMAVRSGAAKPDIHTVAAFRHALLAAKSVVYIDSAGGLYLQNVIFKRLGIEKQMAAKSKVLQGTAVAPTIARGEYEIGFQQLSELKSVPGVDVVGLIPDALQLATPFSAGVVAKAANPKGAHDLIRFLASPAAYAAIEASGLDPAQRKR